MGEDAYSCKHLVQILIRVVFFYRDDTPSLTGLKSDAMSLCKQLAFKGLTFISITKSIRPFIIHPSTPLSLYTTLCVALVKLLVSVLFFLSVFLFVYLSFIQRRHEMDTAYRQSCAVMSKAPGSLYFVLYTLYSLIYFCHENFLQPSSTPAPPVQICNGGFFLLYSTLQHAANLSFLSTYIFTRGAFPVQLHNSLIDMIHQWQN